MFYNIDIKVKILFFTVLTANLNLSYVSYEEEQPKKLNQIITSVSGTNENATNKRTFDEVDKKDQQVRQKYFPNCPETQSTFGNGIDDLPPELVLIIFNYAGSRHIFDVCKLWQNLARQHRIQVDGIIDFSKLKSMPNYKLNESIISKALQYKIGIVINPQSAPEGVFNFSNSNVHAFHKYWMSDRVIHLSSLPNIKNLSLQSARIKSFSRLLQEDPDFFCNISNLKIHEDLLPGELLRLSGATNLTTLTLNSTGSMKDKRDYEVFANFPRLKHLHITEMIENLNSLIAQLDKYNTSLQSLHIKNFYPINDGNASNSLPKSLKKLYLNRHCGGIFSEQNIGLLDNITYLNLQHSKDHNPTVQKHLAHTLSQNKLKILSYGYDLGTFKDIKSLISDFILNSSLQELSLKLSNVPKSSLQLFKQLFEKTNLKILNLDFESMPCSKLPSAIPLLELLVNANLKELTIYTNTKTSGKHRDTEISSKAKNNKLLFFKSIRKIIKDSINIETFNLNITVSGCTKEIDIYLQKEVFFNITMASQGNLKNFSLREIGASEINHTWSSLYTPLIDLLNTKSLETVTLDLSGQPIPVDSFATMLLMQQFYQLYPPNNKSPQIILNVDQKQYKIPNKTRN